MRLLATIAAVAPAILLAAGLPEMLEQYQSQPGNVELCERIGVAYLREEKLAQAADFFRRALRLKPEFLAARKNLGTALWFLDQRHDSEREFERVLKAAPRDPVANLYTGLAAHDRKDFTQAAERLKKAGDLASGNPEVRPILIEALLGAAEIYDRRKSPAKAYAEYREALAVDPNLEAVYLAFSDFAVAHGNGDYAIQLLDEGLRHSPRSAHLLFERGIVLALAGRLDDSDRSFEEARDAEPQWAEPRMALGVSQLQRGGYADAIESFKQAAIEAPLDWRTHYLYALAIEKGGDPSRTPAAIHSLERSIQLAPREPSPRTLLGRFFLETDRTAEAAVELDTAHRIAPEDPAALYRLGIAYRKQGKLAESARMLQAFQSIKTRSRQAESELIQILRTPKETKDAVQR